MEETINREMHLAWSIVEHTGKSLFLTGRAGTGKTTFLRRLRDKSRKRMVVLAPTGIAAINAGGVTIHSFFQLPPSPFAGRVEREGYGKTGKEKLRMIRGLDLIVIDEVSMVRADLLDAVDYELRRIRRDERPFGGVQLLLIGDLQQLPPVVTDRDLAILRDRYDVLYFFGSHALQRLDYTMVELRHVYRQRDERFIDILNKIRDNRAGEAELAVLNRQCRPGFKPAPGSGYIRLTTHNDAARRINEQQLDLLPGTGRTYRGAVKNNFPESSLPVEENLRLKRDAQVMFVKNDISGEHRYYNGLIGKVEEMDSGGVYVRVKGCAEAIYVEPEEWKNVSYQIDEASGTLTEKVNGTYRQLPLRAAWAVTIHKSQGLTFDNAIIDASRSFAHGQCYVALSRCRSLEGIVLEKPLTPAAVINDPEVGRFMTSIPATADDAECRMADMKRDFRISLLDGIFGFVPLLKQVEEAIRVVHEAHSRMYPDIADDWQSACRVLIPELIKVGGIFSAEYGRLISEGDENRLHARLDAANDYFASRSRELLAQLGHTPDICDNSRLTKRLKELVPEVVRIIEEKILVLGELKGSGYSVAECLEARGVARLEGSRPAKKSSSRSLELQSANPGLLAELVRWRETKAAEEDSTPYRVLSYRSMLAISDAVPLSQRDLRKTEGLGSSRIRKYGEDLVKLCRTFKGMPEEEKEHYGPKTKEKREKKSVSDLTPLELELKAWRLARSREAKTRAYMIFSNAVMSELARLRPATSIELAEVPDIPSATVTKYGDEILDIIRDFHD